MQELYEDNDTPLTADTIQLAKTQAVASLAAATSDLARAINNLNYVPTVWVDNSEPDINAANLNKIEQGIFNATEAVKEAAAAIDVLNGNLGNCYALSGGIKIPAAADLNDYKIPGNYYCESDADAKSLKNCPTDRAFIMKIEQSTGVDYYPSQTITAYLEGKRHYRVFNKDNGQWRIWYQYITNSDLAISTYSVPKPATNSVFTNFSLWEATLVKYGHVVVFYMNLNGTFNAVDDVSVLFSIPQIYCPTNNVIVNYISQTGQRMLLAIYPDGKVAFANFSETLNTRFCGQCVTWITNN